MHGGLAAAQFARDSEYTFKNVLMVSPYWSNEDLVIKTVSEAIEEKGTKFYASYSYNKDDHQHPGDTSKTINFVTEKLAGLLSADPWHLPAVFGHDSAVWDVATYDKDKDGRADIWDAILGQDPEVMQDTGTSTNEEEEVDQVTVFADDLLLRLIQREEVFFTYSDIRKVAEKAIQNGIQIKDGQTAAEFIREIAEQFNIPITDSLEPTESLEEGDEQTKDTGKTLADDEKYSEMLKDFAYKPHYNQKDYADAEEHKFGSSTISTSGCGISCIADYLTEKGLDVTPIDLAKLANDKYNFNSSGGADSQLMEKLLADCGIAADRSYWGDAWAPDKDGKRKALEALKAGKEVIVKVQGGAFTNGGHYIRMTGITEDGKVIVYDPYGFGENEAGNQFGNWIKSDPVLVEGFREGFDPQTIWQNAQDSFILEEPTKTASEIIESIESAEDSE